MKQRSASAKRLIAEPTQTLKEIDSQIAKLQQQAASIVSSEKAGVIDRIKEAIGYYGITADELGFGDPAKLSKRKLKTLSTAPSASSQPAKKARSGAGQVKFKDDAGHTWSGFGPKPRWLTDALASGKSLQDLAT